MNMGMTKQWTNNKLIDTDAPIETRVWWKRWKDNWHNFDQANIKIETKKSSLATGETTITLCECSTRWRCMLNDRLQEAHRPQQERNTWIVTEIISATNIS